MKGSDLALYLQDKLTRSVFHVNVIIQRNRPPNNLFQYAIFILFSYLAIVSRSSSWPLLFGAELNNFPTLVCGNRRRGIVILLSVVEIMSSVLLF